MYSFTEYDYKLYYILFYMKFVLYRNVVAAVIVSLSLISVAAAYAQTATTTLTINIGTGIFTVAIVDSSGSPTAGAVTFGSYARSSSCGEVTGTLGTATQKIRITNDYGDEDSWSLGIAPTGGASAKWSDGSSNEFDFNDNGTSGCTDSASLSPDTDTLGGQLTIDPSGATLTRIGTTSATSPPTFGSSTPFLHGTNDSVTLLSGTSSSDHTDAKWDITDISLSQKIPGGQQGTGFSMAMTLTLSTS